MDTPGNEALANAYLDEAVKRVPEFTLWDTFTEPEKLLLKNIVARRCYVMETVKQLARPQRVLYVGSGLDKLPAFVFGKDKVTNISLRDAPYFERRNDKDERNVYASATTLPFKSEQFDIVYTHGGPPAMFENGLSEMDRVLKQNGLLIFDHDSLMLDEDLNKLQEFWIGLNKTHAKVLVPKIEDYNDLKYYDVIYKAVIALPQSIRNKRDAVYHVNPQHIVRIFSKSPPEKPIII